jgi:OFA family oxalate/formate antiporter-like MFS transporter
MSTQVADCLLESHIAAATEVLPKDVLPETLLRPATEASIVGQWTDASASQPSRLYYGWVIVPLAMLAMVANSPGQTLGISIFNEPIRQSLNLSHSQLGGAYTLGTLLGAIPIMYIGALVDRYGLRRALLGLLTLFCGACLMTGAAYNWWTLMVAFCLLRMLGPGALSLVSSSILPFWFDRRLGTVEGIRSLGHAGSMALIPAVNLWLVSHYGWRGAYLLFGVGIWAVLFPVYWLLFRNRPEDVGQKIDGGRYSGTGSKRESGPTSDAVATNDSGHGRRMDRAAPAALRGMFSAPTPSTHDFTLRETLGTFAFWVAALGTAAFGLVHTALFFCLIPIYQERGLTELHAATSMMMFAISLALVQFLGGVLADRMKSPPLLAIGLAGTAMGVVMLYFATTPLGAIASSIVMGSTLGIHSGAVQPLWARYFGRMHLGKIRGLLTTLCIALSSLGPLIAGTVRDFSGNFDLAMWIFIAIPLPLAILSWFAVPPKVDSAAQSPVTSTVLAGGHY